MPLVIRPGPLSVQWLHSGAGVNVVVSGAMTWRGLTVLLLLVVRDAAVDACVDGVDDVTDAIAFAEKGSRSDKRSGRLGDAK